MSRDLAPAPTTLGGGRYELAGVLGTGGMALVRLGTDTLLGRSVAIKVFRADLDEDGAHRAQLEMQTLASLGHPGLVSVYDAGTEQLPDGRAVPYLVMELIEGPTLAVRSLDRSLTPPQLASIGNQLANALDYVHSRGVVHRDVKPANILLAPTGPKLADFGIARIVDGARHTGTGLTIGTAPYLSPEQVTGSPVGPAADVYALGLVLLECLTGHREYDGGPVECALARLHRAPDVPRELPAPWPGLLTAMTARQPEDRPTALQVAQVLREGDVATVATATATAVTTSSADRTAVLRVQPQRRTRGPLAEASAEVLRTRALPAALLGVLVALVVVGLVLVARAGSSAGPAGASSGAATSGPTPSPAVGAVRPAGAPADGPLERDIADLTKAVTP